MTAAEDAVRAYLDAADERVPGLVTGVYGYGSLALDDWRPGVSDVDLLIITSRPCSAADLDALESAHTAIPASPPLDVVYVPASWLELSPLPDDQRATPYWLEGVLHRDEECGLLTPVMWSQVTRYGQVFRGKPLTVAVDPERVRRYNLENLRSYWATFPGWLRTSLSEADPGAPFDPTMLAWVVLGPPRLHYTLATGDITSKAGAGGYLAGQFPQYAELALGTVAGRRGEPVGYTVADALLAADMIDTLTDDAWKRWG